MGRRYGGNIWRLLEEVEELRQSRELTGHKDEPNHDHEGATREIQHTDPACERARHATRAADARGDDEERHAETERVREEQHRTRREVFVEEQVQDEREIGTDARREADAEREADEERTRQSGGVA